MNDKRFAELTQIYFLNEIADDERIELENYLLENDEAKKEYESLINLFTTNYKYALSGAATLVIGIFLGYLFFSPSQIQLPLSAETQKEFDLDKIREGGADISN